MWQYSFYFVLQAFSAAYPATEPKSKSEDIEGNVGKMIYQKLWKIFSYFAEPAKYGSSGSSGSSSWSSSPSSQ